MIRSFRGRRSLACAVGLSLAVLAGACGTSSPEPATSSGADASSSDGQDAPSTGSDASSADSATEAGGQETDAAEPDDGAAAEPSRGGDGPPMLLTGGRTVNADLAGPTTEVETLRNDPYVGAAVYPRPEYEANPWSQWGQGIALEDGRVVVAIGDHLGPDGNSYLFLYDPESATLTRFTDVLSAVDHQPGSWGYGKIHSQMVDPGDGGIWFTTYYGTRRNLTFDGGYEGDILFRLDKASLELEPIAVPAPRFGVPSLATDGAGLIFGEAVNPLAEDYPSGGFFVYDVDGQSLRLFDESDDYEIFRSILVDGDGEPWFAGPEGSLLRYDPADDSVTDGGISVGPGGLRAVTRPASDGTVFGVTGEPYDLFALGPDGALVELGQAAAYTTSVALLPDESGFVYVPGAHGDAPAFGAPLIRVDGTTGEQTVIAELDELIEDRYGLVLGGTYSVTIDEERNHAHIGFNAGASSDDPWGELVFVVIELP